MKKELVSLHRSFAKPLDPLANRMPSTIAMPRPDMPLILSVSEASAFLRCRQRWYWSYMARLRSKKDAPLRSIGILVHEILEAYYGKPVAKRTVKRMTKLAHRTCRLTELKALDTASRELVEAMCIGYSAWVNNPQNENSDKNIGLAECYPEDWFEFYLTPDGSIRVRGKIDVVFPSKIFRKTVAHLETKTKSDTNTDTIDMNYQLSFYSWALRQKYPGMKRYMSYYQILRRQKPGPRVKAPLFHREAVERTSDEIDQWVKDTQLVALDFLNARIYPHTMGNCNWDCDFQKPCGLRGDRSALRHIFKTEFYVKEKDK